ncbi:MAG TPA: MBL fold metallo-hydrolase [Candidatus Dormibacteraeota bacterium]|nr:MBL fold metallo-hydrolase [Candidatus Dormibacteraeota bacterium]
MYVVEAVPAPELGNASFVAFDEEHGAGLVIDPLRDIERYVHVAAEHNVRLTHALDTHLHNDYVSGRRELAAEAHVDIGELAPGAEVRVGAMTVRALHTPGHTPDHKAYVLSEGGRDRALFSGGAVMIGSIARTDLFGPHHAVHLALEALGTLRVRLRDLPDDIRVFPTHGAGSFCGIGGRSGHETTLGAERQHNPFFQMTEVMPFLARVLNQPRYPTYYRDMAAVNVGGPALIGVTLPALTKLDVSQTAQLQDAGAAIVDIRPGREYDHGHIPGSYSIGMEGPVSAWVGWLVARGRPIVLVGGTDHELRSAQRQLLRIGFDTVAGHLDGGMGAWQSAGREVSTFETVDVEDMAQWVLSAEPMTLIDARDEHEWVAGHVPGAVHMYVPDVPFRAGEIPREAPVAVHCASGYRAGIAASLLEQAGLKRIIHVNGEYSDWDRLHLAESRP